MSLSLRKLSRLGANRLDQSAVRALAWAAAIVCIGRGTAVAQLGPGVPEPRDRALISLPAREEAFDSVVAELTPERRATWGLAWSRVRDLGRVAVLPLTTRFDAAAADYRRRLLLLGAIVAAGSEAADEYLLGRLARSGDGQDDQRERFVALELLALGDERSGDGGPLGALVGRSGLDPLQQVAACLALRRFAGAEVELPGRWYRGHDAGLAAAARFARPLARDRALAGWFRGSEWLDRLVQRGALLGARAGSFDPDMAAQVRQVIERRGLDSVDARVAAAVFLSTADDLALWLKEGGLSLDPELVPAIAAVPACRAELMRRGVLVPAPDRLEPVLRARTALAFALACDRQQLQSTAGDWRATDVAEPICLGVAWRFLQDSKDCDTDWIALLPDTSAREWVRFACGESVAESHRHFDDPGLGRAFDAAREGRLPKAAAAAAIENALWRSGAHLGLGRREAEHALVRDLLVAGSTYGGSVLGRGEDAYLPKGLSPGDTAFEIAFELWRFFSAPGSRPPASCRLQ